MILQPTDPLEVLTTATVLVADDHEPNVLLMRRILLGAGIADVHTTTEAGDAVRLFGELDPDIVLLDLHMPGIDGVAVMEAIRTATPYGHFVPIIVLTADSTPEARQRVLAAGANDFLTKPIDRTEVVLRVRNLLHTRSLHEQLRSHNTDLQSEIDQARADTERAEAETAAKRSRIQHALDSAPPRVLYQPIFDLNTMKVIGYEALSRFDQRPCRPPDEWFGEASEVGLGMDLELAAVAAALRTNDIPDDALLALNISPTTAASGRLGEILAGTPADKVVLEITEHARIDDYDSLIAALLPLRFAGVRLAVDDAGAGFSSLSHILRLQPDIIKLDISLVRGIDHDPVKRALSSSLVAFAREIGAQIIAEGIETGPESQAVADLGVQWGQGYYLGRPEQLPSRPRSTAAGGPTRAMRP